MSMRWSSGIGAVLGLALSRMAFFLFSGPPPCNTTSTCPTGPSFWPWAVGGVIVGAALGASLALWHLNVSRVPSN